MADSVMLCRVGRVYPTTGLGGRMRRMRLMSVRHGPQTGMMALRMMGNMPLRRVVSMSMVQFMCRARCMGVTVMDLPGNMDRPVGVSMPMPQVIDPLGGMGMTAMDLPRSMDRPVGVSMPMP